LPPRDLLYRAARRERATIVPRSAVLPEERLWPGIRGRNEPRTWRRSRVSLLDFYRDALSSITRGQAGGRASGQPRARSHPCRTRLGTWPKTNRDLFICLSGTGARWTVSPRFTAAVPISRISKAIPHFISLALRARQLSLSPSLSLSVVVFSSTAVPIPRVVLSPRPACRRLLHRAFALEVISKNFWRWIVPRDGNRGLTLPAAFTQTTEETTFASVRVTTVRLTINERNNTRDSRDSSSESARASCRAGRDEICGCGGFHTAEIMTKNAVGDVGERRIESCKQRIVTCRSCNVLSWYLAAWTLPPLFPPNHPRNSGEQL